ncbi:Bcr/CflA family efflux MFS transporter [Devosia faecipullorum]|uniref:Bcr/CflA family efflux MFS transporter n=1 Tax=Devosia faecipullorum TaxID=2755039 RepID=UPI00187B38D7|nr:Bcr/CflA family efflux MFS transporter [Devosia faecipullorum]MBE7734098.1 Bcr/CflA family efflux MFS transporter [Devosia faecipullorum]
MSGSAMSERRLGLVGAIMVALGPLSVAIYTPALPTIVGGFRTSEAAGNLTISVFYIGLALGQLLCGLLSDGLGRRNVALGFFSLYLVAAIACLVAPTIETLIVARAFQGVGASAGLVISRALVRDLFTGQASSRILNMMAIIIAAGPAIAPAIGSLMLAFGDYHWIFVAMVVHGMVALLLAGIFIVETVPVDLARLRPLGMLRSMGMLLTSRAFLLPALCTAGCAGAIYGQASILPFLLISRVGISPQEFGLGMFLQSGVYMLASLWTRFLLRRFAAAQLVPWGAGIALIGALALMVGTMAMEPTFWSVMLPVALYAFGYAHAAPAVMTAAFSTHKERAGAASALHGFMQIATGFIIGLLATLFVEPAHAMGLLVGSSIIFGALTGLAWHHLDRDSSA